MPRIYRRSHRVRIAVYLNAEQVEWIARMAHLDPQFTDRSDLARWLVAAGITAYRDDTTRQDRTEMGVE